jgi:hypothetical protein
MGPTVRRGGIPESTWGERIVRLLSRQHTTRASKALAATLAAGALGLSAALLGASPASAADPTTPGPNTIIFKGNCGVAGALSSAKPSVNGKNDTEAMTVTAGTTLTIVDGMDLGAAGTLVVNGKQSPMTNGQYATYLPQTGPVNISFTPTCGLSLLTAYKAIAVTVTPAAAPTGGNGQTGSGSGSTGTGSGNQSGTQNGSSKTGSQAQAPGTPPASGVRAPQLPAIHGPVARGAVPSGAADPNSDSGTSGGDTSSTTAPVGKVKLADPRPLGNAGPTGTTSLLALIAAVCLVGVGVAAFRTVFGGRQANRTAAST